jgi:uncharacterized membrane protein (DUF373 family)
MQIILIDNMKCQRCNQNEGEYLCSVCNRVVCSNCKVIDGGKVYCSDHSPRAGLVTNENAKQRTEPKIIKTLKELIYADAILLIGIIIIFVVANFFIRGMLSSLAEQVKDILPQISFVFSLLTFFELYGLYSIIGLFIILIALIIIFIKKRRKYKNI